MQVCSRRNTLGSARSAPALQIATRCPSVCEQEPCRAREATEEITKTGKKEKKEKKKSWGGGGGGGGGERFPYASLTFNIISMSTSSVASTGK